MEVEAFVPLSPLAPFTASYVAKTYPHGGVLMEVGVFRDKQLVVPVHEGEVVRVSQPVQVALVLAVGPPGLVAAAHERPHFVAHVAPAQAHAVHAAALVEFGPQLVETAQVVLRHVLPCSEPRSQPSAGQWQSVDIGNVSRIFDGIFEMPCAEWYTSVESRRQSTVELKSKAFLVVDSGACARGSSARRRRADVF
eukprot:1184674-Prorocentrum_minimum.AAC.4